MYHCEVLYGGTQHHEEVPDGMCERNYTVALEEYHTDHVDRATLSEVPQASMVKHGRNDRCCRCETYEEVDQRFQVLVLFMVLQLVENATSNHQP